MAESSDPLVSASDKLGIALNKFKKRLSDGSSSENEFEVKDHEVQRNNWYLKKEGMKQQINRYNVQVPIFFIRTHPCVLNKEF